MSHSPRAVLNQNQYGLRSPLLRQGPKMAFSDDYTNGPGQWEMAGGGTIEIINDTLEVTNGTDPTILTSLDMELQPGVTYQVELNAQSNEGTVEAAIDGSTVIPATSATGIMEGTFTAESDIANLEVTYSGTDGSLIKVNNVRVML